MASLTTPVLPVIDAAPSPALLGAISRATPLLIPYHLLADVLPTLPPNLPYLVHVSSLHSLTPDALADLLDNGAEALVLDADTPPALSLFGGQAPMLPTDRIVLHLEAAAGAKHAPGSLQGLAGLLVTLDESSALQSEKTKAVVDTFTAALDARTNGKPVYVAPAATLLPGAKTIVGSVTDVAHFAKRGASLVVRTSALALVAAEEETAPAGSLDLAAALLSPLVSDRTDGLFPTTVVASALSSSLGLVYSSRASIRESLLTGSAVYQSRTRGIWRKGETSGATQQVVRLRFDCDADAIEFRVRQRPGTQHAGFCHLTQREGCFGPQSGLAALEATLVARKANAPPGSYTARLFSDAALLGAKLREEAAELAEARDEDPAHVAFEAADLLYFALARCVRAGVSLEQVEASLDHKAKKVTRRTGDAKPQFAQEQAASTAAAAAPAATPDKEEEPDHNAPIKIQSYRLENISAAQRVQLLRRPALKSAAIQELVRPILASVKERGDAALLELTERFDKAKLTTPMVYPPFATPQVLARIKPEVKTAMDQAYANIYKFHLAQKRVGGNKPAAQVGAGGVAQGTGEEEEDSVLEVETMPGVVCRRFARPIERVGLYVPGGTAVLPSTALMLGVPAQVARCPTRIIATPPRPDGSIAPEVLYAAHLVGATAILAAGGAQAVGALAYGTASVPKVDKICGPGNQFVTAAKLLVQNDMDACVSIDMPAGPSEVLVIADATSDADFVASDLLSQAEHGPDSQVVLVAIDLNDEQLAVIEQAIDRQAKALPRCAFVRKAIEKSVTIRVPNREEAMRWSNDYAPEHLIIQTQEPEQLAKATINAGSIFVGNWSPESCGDYASGTNHSLPTNAFARQYSGVNTDTFVKRITSQSLTAEGLRVLGPHVEHLAACEGLDAHKYAVTVRLQKMAAQTAKK